MVNYISTKGGIDPVRFDTALLQGIAEDTGLFAGFTSKKQLNLKPDHLTGVVRPCHIKHSV